LAHQDRSIHQLFTHLNCYPLEVEKMAPSSFRSLLSYAGGFLSQLPTSLHNPGPIADIVPYEPLSGIPSCPIEGPTSCHNSTPIAGDSCCFVYPGGRMLLTQFWDTQIHAGGSEQDWTLHGLWYVLDSLPSLQGGRRGRRELEEEKRNKKKETSRPKQGVRRSGESSPWLMREFDRPDLCDGTYDQFCHMTPTFNNITDILNHYEQQELLQFMNRYWLSN
jgi:ribonuclease T2